MINFSTYDVFNPYQTTSGETAGSQGLGSNPERILVLNVQYKMNGRSYPAQLHSPLNLSAVRQVKLMAGRGNKGF
jgi:hypothetical protein